jgi:2-polyprenyl-6-hydroxyphenyl methylase/3-demethylubiquinone-9 3-methyltransferase
VADRCPLRDCRLLDVGCGGGILSEPLARRGARVTGIDMGTAALAVARHHMAAGGLTIDYRRTTVEALADREPAAFDVVVCMELQEHVPDPASVLAACSRLLRPGGNLFLATLNRTLLSFLLAILVAEHLLGVVAPGTHRHRKFIRPSELAGWARRCGLEIANLSGLCYLPVVRKTFLVPSAAVNYLMHLKRPAAAVGADR